MNKKYSKHVPLRVSNTMNYRKKLTANAPRSGTHFVALPFGPGPAGLAQSDKFKRYFDHT